MLFNSLEYRCFLVVCVVVTLALPHRAQNRALLFAYDFIAAPEARRTTALRARSMLEGRRARARTAFASAVLRDAGGALVRADLDRLRALRDDSPENLLE